MIKRLTIDTITANLYSMAPNFSGGIWLVLGCWLSDRFQQRAFAAIGSVAVSMIGFICLGSVDLVHNTGLGYFFTFLVTCGVSVLHVENDVCVTLTTQ